MAHDRTVTEVHRVVVEIEVCRPEVRAEWIEGTREADVGAVIRHRIIGAFNHVEGFERVQIIGKGVIVR